MSGSCCTGVVLDVISCAAVDRYVCYGFWSALAAQVVLVVDFTSCVLSVSRHGYRRWLARLLWYLPAAAKLVWLLYMEFGTHH